MNVFREEADSGEGEESPWLLQGEKRDPRYDDVKLSAPGTSRVTFLWFVLNTISDASDILIVCIQ